MACERTVIDTPCRRRRAGHVRIFTKRTNLAAWQAVVGRDNMVAAWLASPDAGRVERVRSFMLGRMLEWATTVSTIPNLFEGYVRVIAAGQRIVFTQWDSLPPPIAFAEFSNRILQRVFATA